MSRIFVETSLTVGSSIRFEATTNHYLRNVLRLKPDAEIALFNGTDNCDYQATLDTSGKQFVATIFAEQPSVTDSDLDSEIIQGLSRSDHLDLTIQKATELGVHRITIFNAEYSQIPLKQKQLEKRLTHWRAITISACEQSGRHKLPEITFYKSLKAVIETDVQRKTKLLLDFDAVSMPKYLSNTPASDQVSLLIGPEGGLSKSEIQLCKDNGFLGTSLGPRVLRTESAAIAALAIVQAYWGDLSMG